MRFIIDDQRDVCVLRAPLSSPLSVFGFHVQLQSHHREEGEREGARESRGRGRERKIEPYRDRKKKTLKKIYERER